MRPSALLVSAALAALLPVRAFSQTPAPAAVPAAPAPAPKTKLPPPPEVVFALKQADYRVRVTVRPGEPQPGKLVELQLEVSQTRDPPDPTYGDEAPVENAQLGITFSGPGTKARHQVRPLPDIGSYGVHWTPVNKGLWTATIAPLAGPGPSVSFELGVGVPMPPSAQGQEVQSSRNVIGSRGAKRAAPLTPVMHEVAERWLKLLDAQTDAAGEASKIGALFRSLVGRAPAAFATSENEFDELAKAAAVAAEGAAHAPFDSRDQAMRAVELNSCTRCHVKYRDGVVEDVSRWPEVKPWVR